MVCQEQMKQGVCTAKKGNGVILKEVKRAYREE